MDRFIAYKSSARSRGPYGGYVNLFVVELDLDRIVQERLKTRLAGEQHTEFRPHSIRDPRIKKIWWELKGVYGSEKRYSEQREALERIRRENP